MCERRASFEIKIKINIKTYTAMNEIFNKIPLGYTVAVTVDLDDKLARTFVSNENDCSSKIIKSVNETFSKQSLGYTVMVPVPVKPEYGQKEELD